MQKVLGLAGVFIRARDPQKLAKWYEEHLGLPIEAEWNGAILPEPIPDAGGIWSAFPPDTDYFGLPTQQSMVSFRVPDRDAMLAQLRAGNCNVADETMDSQFGKFGWVTDPEGNRVELWEAPAT